MQILAGTGWLAMLAGAAGATPPCAVTHMPTSRSILTPEGGIAVEVDPTRIRDAPACAGPVRARSAPTAERFVGSGPSTDRLDLLVLGDGYTADDTEAFEADAEALVAALLATEPFTTHGGALNAWRSRPASAESGVSKDTRFETVTRDTALSCTYGCGGADRIVCCDDTAVLEAAETALPDADALFVLVNDDTYGGAGSPVYSVSYTGPGFEPVGVHELGHVLGGLYDEYEYGFDAGGYGPNCAVSPAFLPWDAWVGEQGVAWFSGCTYDSLFRPTETGCLMRELEGDFCPVCAEALTLSLLDDAPVLAGLPEAPVAGSSLTVALSDDAFADTHVSWAVDGEPFAEGPTVTLPTCGSVTVTARWESSFVLSDPEARLADTRTFDLGPCASTGCAVVPRSTGAWMVWCVLALVRRRR